MQFVQTGRQFPHRLVIAVTGDGTRLRRRRLYLRRRLCLPRRLRSALELVGGLLTMALFLGVAILL
jgi:hypothetical protein